MADSRTLRLQRALGALALDADEAALEADPGRVARRQELSGADQRAFRDQGPALMTYRELVRLSLVEPLETMFPVLRSLLEGAGSWEGCVQAFLEARVVRSPHYRDLAPAFLGWLADTRWGQERWPFLLELAHAETLETLVARFPDSEPLRGLHADPGPGDLVVLDPSARLVSYGHAVHRARVDAPVPEARPTHLLVFRDGAGEARLLELTPATAALLVRAQSAPLGEAAAALGLTDPAPATALLCELQRDGAIAGFQSLP
jgi:hypothetical protein